MATQGVFNGTDLLIKVIGSGGTLATIGHTTSCSISFSQDLPDATTKDSAGWNEVIAGARGGSISFDGLVAYDDAANSVEIADYIINRTKVDFSFGTAASGDTIYTGSGFIDSLEVSADAESPVSYSGSITITGAIVSEVNA
jgi:TP901-1 family phage major tail protein